ncbi:MAG: serine/threonine-protein kinase [Acidobacteriota bacterium]
MPADPERIKTLFHLVLGMNPDRRRAFLEHACADAPEVRRELEGLLAAASDVEGFMEGGPSPGPIEEPTQPLPGVPGHGTRPLSPGSRVASYEIDGLLCTGGMSTVYCARDLRTGRPVALKLMALEIEHDTGARSRFVLEAKLLGSIDHESVASVNEAGDDGGRLYIALPLYDGEDLGKRIARGPIPLPEARRILERIARGLRAAHRKRIIHRDLKPSNVILTADGRVKILDFGLAKLVRDTASTSRLTSSGVVMGTVSYMSPEQARGEKVDARTDLWSLGVIAYQLLTGVSPFDAGSAAGTLVRILTTEPRPIAELRAEAPTDLASLVTRLLSKDREERPRDCDEVLASLAGKPAPRRYGAATRWGIAAVLGAVTLAGPCSPGATAARSGSPASRSSRAASSAPPRPSQRSTASPHSRQTRSGPRESMRSQRPPGIRTRLRSPLAAPPARRPSAAIGSCSAWSSWRRARAGCCGATSTRRRSPTPTRSGHRPCEGWRRPPPVP